ncbi:MAG: SagB/ThcOx family dehydrogenase [Planctomycetota bacterium]|jgi:SagB-type dehydrogenase family enzyme
MNGIGDKFHQQTKYNPAKMPSHSLDWASQPELYKRYPSCEGIKLPHFWPERWQTSLQEALRARKSIRSFPDKPLWAGHVSYLLWASTGIQRFEHGHEFRTAPSAGALYPIETYLIANNIDTLDKGLYHYSIKPHCVEQIKKEDLRAAIAAATLGQSMCAEAAVVFVWSAVFQRCKWKYGQRAYRYVYLDAGHIAENLALAAVSLNLGSCEIGAFYDDQVNEILGIDGVNESAICMAAIGRPA